MKVYYAGIGSRKTPYEYIELFKRVASYLTTQNAILRSGGAEGADKAFEIGCDMKNGKKEIYLPWKYFNNSPSELIVTNPSAFEIAKQFHPNWNYLSQGAKKLQARNSHQVLGIDLKTPSKFIICWTENGKGGGGTGQALRIARNYDIPCFDCGNYDDIDKCRIELFEFLKKYMDLDSE